MLKHIILLGEDCHSTFNAHCSLAESCIYATVADWLGSYAEPCPTWHRLCKEYRSVTVSDIFYVRILSSFLVKIETWYLEEIIQEYAQKKFNFILCEILCLLLLGLKVKKVEPNPWEIRKIVPVLKVKVLRYKEPVRGSQVLRDCCKTCQLGFQLCWI